MDFYNCEYCFNSFPSYNRLTRHIRFQHEFSYSCSFPNCGFRSEDDAAFNCHVASMHRDKAPYQLRELTRNPAVRIPDKTSADAAAAAARSAAGR